MDITIHAPELADAIRQLADAITAVAALKAPAAPTEAPAPRQEAPIKEAPTAEPPTGVALGLDDLREVLCRLREQKGKEAVRSILNTLGAESVPKIPPERYAEALQMAEAALAA